MNNPEDVPIDATEMIEWIKEYRQVKNMSWAGLARVSGIPAGTLNPVGLGVYKGNIDNIARKIYMFRQKVESQQARVRTLLNKPTFLETKTARRILSILEQAQDGGLVLIATGPGTGKTMTAEHYRKGMSNVWLATMDETTRTPTAMIAEVLRAMRISPVNGRTDARSVQIKEHMQDRQGLLLVDEANHLDLPAIEVLRNWHDISGGGIALLGNEELYRRIYGHGTTGHQYARLRSRIAMDHHQDMPRPEDVSVYLDNAGIESDDVRQLLSRRALARDSGGLREIQKVIELAHKLAIGEDTVVADQHFRDALQVRSTSYVRGAAA
ncbi:AAA family ATPase [Sphingomonas hengshuiensis]|uniref:AAA+ ATPase domain-containing protein n=1 Tax=Sphingomonas hengshuiensis TaxID=1609977 RepID=A0A7U4JAC6_9SPHN|nr:AAA family ATPase [Sphingomonas hengshuiensis]AJP73148.1 hypothetical protein TS85_17140 [Sphingomonas hengshuiensis]